MDKIIENFEKISARFPGLTPVLSAINSASIRYGLHGGSHVSLLTSNREINDLDFLVADEDFNRLKRLFPEAKTKDRGKYGSALFLIIGQNEELEFFSHTDFDIAGSHYTFRLSEACWNHTRLIKSGGQEIRLLNEVDTILQKAMLQRKEKEGKHDLEDIEAILQNREIDKEYLQTRLSEINPDERLLKILRKFQLI